MRAPSRRARDRQGVHLHFDCHARSVLAHDGGVSSTVSDHSSGSATEAPIVITYAVNDMRAIATRLKEIERERMEAINRQRLPDQA